MLTVLLATLPGLVSPPAQDEAARTLALLRTPERALLPGGDPHMLPLLRSYTELLNWKLVLDPELEQALAQLETGLDSPAEIAREDVHPLVQHIVRAHNLCFRLDPQPDQPQLLVQRAELVGSARAPNPFLAPIAIPPALLPAWSSHPAFVLSVELAHAPEGSEDLCARLRALCAKTTSRVDIARSDSGALRFTASSAVLEFLVEALVDAAKYAEPLDSIRFPADPNTPAGKAAAVLPERLRSAFPTQDAALTLRSAPPKDDAAPAKPGAAPLKDLDIVRAYSRWSARPILFLNIYTCGRLRASPAAADTPDSVPPAWAHEFVSGLLADAGLPLAPLPARRPVLWTIEARAPQQDVGLDLASVPAVRLDELAAVGHLAATRFVAFVRLPALTAEALHDIAKLESPDARTPFWITQLDDPQLFSIIGTPRAITSAVLALKLLLAPPKPR